MSSPTLTMQVLQELLPSFQGKKHAEEVEPSLKSNCPKHIPSPVLLPGEELMLKEHRVMCVDATEEPMIGAMCITNYRLIFSGNLLSDANISMILEFQEGVKLRKHKKVQNPKPVVQTRTQQRRNNISTLPSFNSFLDSTDSVSQTRPRFKFGQQLKNLKDGFIERTRTKRVKTSESLDIKISNSKLEELAEETLDTASCGSVGSDSLYDLSLEIHQQHTTPDPTLSVDIESSHVKNGVDEPDFEKIPDSPGLDVLVDPEGTSNASSLIFDRLVVSDESNDEELSDAVPVSSDTNLDTCSDSGMLSMLKFSPTVYKEEPPENIHQFGNNIEALSNNGERHFVYASKSLDSSCLSETAGRPRRKPVTLPRQKVDVILLQTVGDSSAVANLCADDGLCRNHRPKTLPRKFFRNNSEGSFQLSSASSSSLVGGVREKPPVKPRTNSNSAAENANLDAPVPKPRLKTKRLLTQPAAVTVKPELSSSQGSSKPPVIVTTDPSGSQGGAKSHSTGGTKPFTAFKLNFRDGVDSGSWSAESSPVLARKNIPNGRVNKKELLRPLSIAAVATPQESRKLRIPKSASTDHLEDEESSPELSISKPAIKMAPFEDKETFEKRFIVEHKRSKSVRLSSKMRSRSHLLEVTDMKFDHTVFLPLECIRDIKRFPSHFSKQYDVPLHDGIVVLCKNCQSLKLSIHRNNTYNAGHVKRVIEGQLHISRPFHRDFAFIYCSAIKSEDIALLASSLDTLPGYFSWKKEFDRLGILDCELWRVCDVRENPTKQEICPSYPDKVIVPVVISDLDLIRGAEFYKENRFPAVCWRHRSGAVLLRGGSATARRGAQNSVSGLADEAFLKAVVGCIEHIKFKGVKLNVFTEKYEQSTMEHMHSSTESFHGTLGGRLTQKQATRYYYHSCEFVEADSPPSFKNIRHSFDKLHALFENKVSDSEYLSALDETKWLKYIGELLKTSSEACKALQDGASVIVCYEAGWDRTAQIVSLAQLMLDPYYRTMEGFQVLIQKEWVWFGHPFASRHSTHRGESGPIFLQFIDCVWQVLQQCPSAFEINGKFLETLVDYSYSGLFGTFLANQETDRRKDLTPDSADGMTTIYDNTVSFWGWLAMVNATDRSFYNELYCPDMYTQCLYPQCGLAYLSLWTLYYCRFNIKEHATTMLDIGQETLALLKLYKDLKLQETPDSDSKSHPTTDCGDSCSVKGEQPKYTPPATRLSSGDKKEIHKPECNSIIQCLTKRELDASITKQMEFTSYTCSGYLVKLGGRVKSWRRRWFVLDFTRQYCAYFEDENAYLEKRPPKGGFDLQDIEDVFQKNKNSELINHIFHVKTESRTYSIQAPSITTLNLWMACLQIKPSELL